LFEVSGRVVEFIERRRSDGDQSAVCEFAIPGDQLMLASLHFFAKSSLAGSDSEAALRLGCLG
jgi:hypothetical protein